MACTGSRLPRDRVAKTGEVGPRPLRPYLLHVRYAPRAN